MSSPTCLPRWHPPALRSCLLHCVTRAPFKDADALGQGGPEEAVFVGDDGAVAVEGAERFHLIGIGVPGVEVFHLVQEDAATGSASGPLGAFAVKYGLVERAPRVSLVSEQGTKMGRQSFVHIELEYGASKDLPESIEVGGSVMPVLSGTLADFA